MTIHVNIGEAKTRLSALLAAARRGEEVIINRNGKPDARLVPVDEGERLQEIAARRRAAFGMWKGKVADVDWFEPISEDELAEWYDSPLFPPDDDEQPPR